MSSRYDRSRLFRFYKTAEYADQSWARIYENSANLAAVGILSAAAGWLASLGQDNETLAIPTGMWIFGAVGWAAVVYLFAEIELMRRFGRDSDEASFSVPDRNPPAERSLFRKALVIGALFFVAGAIAIRALVG